MGNKTSSYLLTHSHIVAGSKAPLSKVTKGGERSGVGGGGGGGGGV